MCCTIVPYLPEQLFQSPQNNYFLETISNKVSPIDQIQNYKIIIKVSSTLTTYLGIKKKLPKENTNILEKRVGYIVSIAMSLVFLALS